MLILKGIVKDYITGEMCVEALRGIDLEFRKSEFVSILGPSGCGKTTLLNIIGGLDRYTSGDLSINGKSTKEFKDGDWDAYRNHAVGFVFQNYNLIPHQTVLSNVELALTLSGVSKAERRKRAAAVLEQVGLGDQMHKKPNQMSGGQMQRVAIARALINNPDILLADEPTGALDSETSVQIMEILKEISKEKLIIMVTHNPDLAEKYSSRIIRLLDGRVIDDTNPCHTEPEPPQEKRGKGKIKRPSMSFFTALSLSLNNLMTKKARTFLTAFAGSIGIIGIALILSLSSGVQNYIDRVQEDTLSSYPLTIENTTTDISKMMSSIAETRDKEISHGMDKVYADSTMNELLKAMLSERTTNDLQSFKHFLEEDGGGIPALCSDIQYGYSTTLNIYKSDTSDRPVKVNPSTVLDAMGFSSQMSEMSSMMGGTDVWEELLGNEELLATQYDVIAGRMPERYDEVVIIVHENNEISDYTLYSLGLKDVGELSGMMQDLMAGKEVEIEQTSYTYDELLSLTFKLLINTDYYREENGRWVDESENPEYIKTKVESAEEIRVVGILRPSEGSTVVYPDGAVGYTAALMEHLIAKVNDSEIVKEQKVDPSTDVFTGLPFTADTQNGTSYEENLSLLGVSDPDVPSSIKLYPKDFAAKEAITDAITEYNRQMRDDEKENLVIQYTDYVGLIISSVTTIINAISYVLIAFVAISLIVSSIMIGIITYISVLERTKEIGILRSIGASKRDVSRVFNAETLLVGLVAGLLGIGISCLLTIPINMIIRSLTDVQITAAVPVIGGVILVGISMLLTFIAGLIPSRIAAKKDPVVALRTE